MTPASASNTPPDMPLGKLFGLPVALLGEAQVVERIAAYLASSQAGADKRRGAWQVVTLNPEIAMRARRNDELRAIIQHAGLVVADGIGVVLALRLRRYRAPERVTGVDLMEALAARAATDGWRVFLLGAQPGVAETAAAILTQRHPGLIAAGTYAGSPTPEDDTATLAHISAAQPDILFVAFGAPAQECWIARQGEQLDGVVALGVGGALDFIAGRVPRAPDWMRRLGLEWLYRLWREPWRWRRMLALPRFALAAVWERET
ncbi:MAG: WecB/TagA/CpsF family glycosyltransferase [Ktedonobacterales bacterium]